MFPTSTAETVVIDGDTIKIQGTSIRLYGIDAPELKHTCLIQKKIWKCGLTSKDYLQKITKNQKIHCQEKYKDKYKRTVAICYANGIDIGQEMVRQGMAIAYLRYSKKYIVDEQYARELKLGIWSSDFNSPKKWRQKH